MPDLHEILSDADREWAEVAESAQLIVHGVLDDDRPVDLDDEYARGEP